jgi:DNA-binding CsgD family transcriptional regulator
LELNDQSADFCEGAMADSDLLLQTIEAIYASSIDNDRLTEALQATTRLLGASGATFEVFNKTAQRHSTFNAVGVPTVARTPYLEHFARINPRAQYTVRQSAGHVVWDHQILDEAGMRRDSFYSEFLSDLGLRYFVGAVLKHTPDEIAVVSVQRTRKQGHVDKREIALMQRLVPHYQRAHDVALRLQTAGDRSGVLENTLDWLADGVALLRADGTIVFINEALRSLAQRGDGFRIAGRAIEFATAEARRRFEGALSTIARVGDPSRDAGVMDFPAPRAGDLPAYIVSVRPLVRGNVRPSESHADVLLLVRDPLWRNAATGRMLQELFGLTNAEAHLTQALCTGVTTGVYALERRVSLNTVYSHLKRIREKTGCKSVPDLIRKFGELNIPLRPSS